MSAGFWGTEDDVNCVANDDGEVVSSFGFDLGNFDLNCIAAGKAGFTSLVSI